MVEDRVPECPRCGKHTIVQLRADRWRCLNCNFSKNFAQWEWSGAIATVGLAILLAAIAL